MHYEKELATIRALLTAPTAMELGPGPRAGVWALTELNTALAAWSHSTRLANERQQLVRAAVLLWHDHHDASHEISQRIETPDGSWLHGILHRREPDYWNAQYWFRRVGKHPAFVPLAVRARALLDAEKHSSLAETLLPRGVWDAEAFVKAVEQACTHPADTPQMRCLIALQQVEFDTALEHFCTVD